MAVAHEEDGHITGVTEFPYEEIDRRVFQCDPENDLSNVSQRELDASVRAFIRLVEWMYQTGMKNPDGLKIRAIIVCWVFLKWIRCESLTVMARGYGLKKQSLGRWVDEFKRKFPEYRIVHMRNNKCPQPHLHNAQRDPMAKN